MICYDINKLREQGERTMSDTTNKVRFTTYIPEHLKDEVVKLSEETRIPQARLFEEAVEELLKKYKEKS
jgi:rRNA pseudouridine-1189 N-methylase Emg1 (Nep1/Mra1 family)